MTHTNWLPYAAFFATALALCALWAAVHSISRQWAGRWAALRAQPRWLQIAALVALVWIGLRLARAGWRPLLMFIALLAVFGLWGELAARRRR